MVLTRETEVLGEKPVTVPLCPPQISHTLTWDRTRSPACERPATRRISHGRACTYRNSSAERKNLVSTSQKTQSLCLILLWHRYSCYTYLKWIAACYRQHLSTAAAVFGFFSSSGAVRRGPLASNTVVILSFRSLTNVCQLRVGIQFSVCSPPF